MGDANGEPDEAPRPVTVAAFRIMRHEVTNRLYAAFVAASDHEPVLAVRGPVTCGPVAGDLCRG